MKLKPNKGLLKRVRVTAKGKVKFNRPGKSHLNSGHTGASLRQKRKPGIAKAGDIRRLERMLHRNLIPGDQ